MKICSTGQSRRKWRVLAMVLGLALLFMPLQADDDRVTDELLVELVPGASEQAVADRYGLTIEDGIPAWRLWLMLAPPGTDTDELADEMELDPDVDEAEPHFLLESPEGGQRTIGDLDCSIDIDQFRNQPSALLVKTHEAHESGRGFGCVVAVLDTGMSFLHPATTSQIMSSSSRDLVDGQGDASVQPNSIDDDGDGVADEMIHHGTLVAGMINLAAPDARILPVRVLDAEGWGTAFSVAKGIRYALTSGADVINLSLGMVMESDIVERALEEAEDAGIVVVAAAGNRNLSGLDYPASDEDVIAVTSVDETKVKAAFSSYGLDVDLTAPGVEVLSTFGDEHFGRWDGSSFSAPLVAGAVALVVERYPGLTPDEVRDLLRSTAQPDANGPEWDGLLGAGTLDLEALVAALTWDRTSLKVSERIGGTEIRWTEVKDAAVYDMIRGDVASLCLDGVTVDLGPVNCLKEDTVETSNAGQLDTQLPAPGTAFFYVFRDDQANQNGAAWGSDSEGRDRLADSGDCLVPGGA